MASRQDQLDSYQFTVRRVVGALVTGESDPAEPPLRRLAGSALIGVLVAVLALAAFAVYGVLRPGGGTSWRDESAVVVEKQTGARYVYLGGALHPVPNYASALLIIGASRAHTVQVDRHAIETAPRAAPLGIDGAPDSLPPAGRLLAAPWTVCGDAAGASIHIGAALSGGRPLADEGVLVRTAGASASGVWLIWHGHRHRVTDFALGALAWRGQPVLTVAGALLNAVPAGADLTEIPIDGRGERSAARFAVVGQVFVVRPQGGTPQYAVAVRGGLAAISQVQANLLLGDRRTAAVQGRSGAIDLPPEEYTTAPVAAPLTPHPGDTAPPMGMPALTSPAGADGTLCVRVDGGDGLPTMQIAVPGARVPDTGLRVAVAPGRGALVAVAAATTTGAGGAPAGSASGPAAGSLWLVTDLGRRYPVPGAEALDLLGYGAVAPIRMPAALVAVLPVGPALDPAVAGAARA